MTADDILQALIAVSIDKIWASELAFFGTARRIDFWTLEPARSQGFRAVAHEIKVSRADFHRDDEDKQSGALRFSDRFYYVTPPGLLNRSELPAWAGLMEWDGERFAVMRRPPKREKSEPDWQFVVSLLRNSGDCRRDVGLMRAQMSFLEMKLRRHEQADRTRSTHFFRKWMDAQVKDQPHG